MRLPILAAAVVALAALPTAHATWSNLAVEGPAGPVEGVDSYPLEVRLRLGEFTCYGAAEIVVALSAAAQGELEATVEPATLRFPVESRTYMVDEYDVRAPARLVLEAMPGGDGGRAEVTATLQPLPPNCVTPGGFDAASAVYAVDVVAPPAAEPADGAPVDETDGTIQPGPSARTGAKRDPHACPVEANCGFIGEFDASASGGAKSVPGPGLLLAAFAAGCAALVLRRR